jgi:hypothetical protein
MPLQGHGDWSGRDLGARSEIHVEDMHMLVSQQSLQLSALLRSGVDTTAHSLVCCCSLGPAQTPSLSISVDRRDSTPLLSLAVPVLASDSGAGEARRRRVHAAGGCGRQLDM